MDVLARCHFTSRNLQCGQLAWATVICNGVGSHYGVKEMLLLGSEGIQRQMRARIWALASLIKCAIKFVLVWRQTASNCSWTCESATVVTLSNVACRKVVCLQTAPRGFLWNTKKLRINTCYILNYYLLLGYKWMYMNRLHILQEICMNMLTHSNLLLFFALSFFF